MIKVGITGADTPVAGEILRLLNHHPEVDIYTLYSPSHAGRKVSACHYGFIGESLPVFSDTLDPAVLDIIFLTDTSDISQYVLENSEQWPDLRIVDISKNRTENLESFGMELGLSEMNRKPLVRGARLASVPTPVASLSFIALNPLALNNLVNSDIHITADLPEAIANESEAIYISREIAAGIRRMQPDFNHSVVVDLNPVESARAMKVKVSLKSPLAIAEIDDLYESVYDDHHFTFTDHAVAGPAEVEGTHKCIVTFQKPGAGLLDIVAVGDAYLRGGAGDAVHVLNLFFTLDEKVGLTLKPAGIGRKGEGNHESSSWFA